MTWRHFSKLFWDKYLKEARLSLRVSNPPTMKDGSERVCREVRRAILIRAHNSPHRRRLTEIANQIDNGREGPESYADVV